MELNESFREILGNATELLGDATEILAGNANEVCNFSAGLPFVTEYGVTLLDNASVLLSNATWLLENATDTICGTGTPDYITEYGGYAHSHDDEVVIQSLYIYSSVYVMFFLAFCIVRIKLPKYFNIRSWVPELKCALAFKEYGFFNWFWKVYQAKDDDILEQCGMDALCFLRVLKYGRKLAMFGIFNAIYLLPIYATAPKAQDTILITDKLAEVTTANLPSFSHRFLATVVAAYLIFIYTMYTILEEFEWFTEFRHKFLMQRRARSYAVYVSGIPKEYRSSHALLDYFRKCSSKSSVLEAQIVHDLPKLEAKVSRREVVIGNIEAARVYEKIKGRTKKHLTKRFQMVETEEQMQRELTDLNKVISIAINKILNQNDRMRSRFQRKDKSTMLSFDFSMSAHESEKPIIQSNSTGSTMGSSRDLMLLNGALDDDVNGDQKIGEIEDEEMGYIPTSIMKNSNSGMHVVREEEEGELGDESERKEPNDADTKSLTDDSGSSVPKQRRIVRTVLAKTANGQKRLIRRTIITRKKTKPKDDKVGEMELQKVAKVDATNNIQSLTTAYDVENDFVQRPPIVESVDHEQAELTNNSKIVQLTNDSKAGDFTYKGKLNDSRKGDDSKRGESRGKVRFSVTSPPTHSNSSVEEDKSSVLLSEDSMDIDVSLSRGLSESSNRSMSLSGTLEESSRRLTKTVRKAGGTVKNKAVHSAKKRVFKGAKMVTDIGANAIKSTTAVANMKNLQAVGIYVGLTEGNARPAGFVIFSDLFSKQAALQMIHHPVANAMEVWEAPDPENIYWSNVGLPANALQTGWILSWAATIALCLFWWMPVSFISSLTEVNTLKLQFPGLEQATLNYPWLEMALAQIAPVLLIGLRDVLLPEVLKFFATWEGHISFADLEASLFVKLAVFMIFQTFFITLISGSVAKNLVHMMNHPSLTINFLAIALPAEYRMFIQVLLADAFFIQGLELLRGYPLMVAIMRRFIGPNRTAKERRKSYGVIHSLEDPPDFYIARNLAVQLLFFMIFFVYSTIAPIINFFLVLCLVVMESGYRYHFYHNHHKENDSGGKHWVGFAKIALVNMMVAQIALTGLLVLKNSVYALPFMIPLILGSAYFTHYVNQKYYHKTYFLPTNICLEKDEANLQDLDFDIDDFAAGKYVQPCLRDKTLYPDDDPEV